MSNLIGLVCALMAAAHFDIANPTSSGANVQRVVLQLGHASVASVLRGAGLSKTITEALDVVLMDRLDLCAQAAGTTLTLYLDDDALVALAVRDGDRSKLRAALYEGPFALRGYYDEKGRSLEGPLRARPVPLGRVASGFGARLDPFTGAAGVHHGIDYALPTGTEVVAVGDGVVVARGTSNAGGRFIKVGHRGGYVSAYMHLDGFAGVHVGDAVKKGQLIAWSGNTGRSTGPHLHYELRLADIPQDPRRTLPPPARALGPLALREHTAHLAALEELP